MQVQTNNQNDQKQLIEFSEEDINSAFASFNRRMNEYLSCQIRNKTIYQHTYSDDDDNGLDDEEDIEELLQKLNSKIIQKKCLSKDFSDDVIIIESPQITTGDIIQKENIFAVKDSQDGYKGLNALNIQNGARKSCPIQHQPPNLEEEEIIAKKQFMNDQSFIHKPFAKKSAL